MSQKIERVELELVRGGERVLAHPAFQQAFQALPNLDTRGPLGQVLKGRPWGVPQEVRLSSEDLVALGVPAHRDLQIRRGLLRARLLTTRTKKQMPLATELVSYRRYPDDTQGYLPPGVFGLRQSLAHAREGRYDLRFWQWRCRTHEDCLATPELGIACLAQRGGPGFREGP